MIGFHNSSRVSSAAVMNICSSYRRTRENVWRNYCIAAGLLLMLAAVGEFLIVFIRGHH